ncbi:MAG: copper amine oxidase N-terminal domain-containing protein [Defluviitaleaceae bacterium]|nr:copper amine oxidase N-terminal domain-containing protein [Defluviitaleaceae bacterium]
MEHCNAGYRFRCFAGWCYTLTVLDNTNVNVFASTDEGYEITTHIGTSVGGLDFVVTEIPRDGLKFVTIGEYGEFIDLWLNGAKLIRGADYDAEEGSTVITVREQTFNNLPPAQRTMVNTLAAEFRVDGNNFNDLRRASQNFRIDTGTTTTNNNNTTGNTSSIGGTGIGSLLITDLTGNAKTQTIDVVPIIQNGRTLLSMRFIANAFGASVDWNDAAKEVTLIINGRILILPIGNITPELAVLGMDVPPQIMDGRTMVPLRFISEFFGAVGLMGQRNTTN